MKHDFSEASLRGLRRAGEVIAPGFSQVDLDAHLGRITNFMEPEDKEGFKLLTAILGVLPSFLIHFILWMCTKLPFSIFRQIDLGVKGVVLSLYYSETKTLDMIIHPLPQDTEMENLLQSNNPLMNMVPQIPSDLMDKARRAQPEIAELSVKERLVFIKRIREYILKHQEEIVDVIQRETHKARFDIMTSELFPTFEHLAFLEAEAQAALKDDKVSTPIAMLGKSSKIWYEPVGVVLVISPWNYPFYQAIVPITCAFITGNSTLYKPSEMTPLKGLVEAVLAGCGFKEHWAQVVYGDGAIAVDLIHQRPQKIFFTGSVATGKKIMAQASQYLIPVELELGGKDPMIVFEDANLDRAVKGAIWGSFTNSGQSCTSVERLYVHESIYDAFKTKLVEETKKIALGIDKDGSADMGAMISPKQVGIISDLVKDATAHGAKLLTGAEWDHTSTMIPPMIIEGSDHSMRMNHEEIFGPVLPIMKFKTEEEAIRLANDSNFGLSASVWSKDKERVLRVAKKLVTGNVSINNVMLSEGNHALPFGGVKDSGIGRYKGVHGLRNFCNIKSVLIDADSKKIEANWYPYTPKKYKLFTGLTQGLFAGGLKKWFGLVRYGLPLEGHSQKADRKDQKSLNG
jgi:acyl-CoA reductase-like NAD-dependent aldehyde dehydrogenase